MAASPTTALVLGVIGLVVPICALLALIFGVQLVRRMDAEGTTHHRGRAVAAEVLGVVGLALWVGWLILYFS
jgi:hypothetical protein